MEKRRAELMKSGLYGEALQPDTGNGKYGPIPGVKVGDRWSSRKECANAGVHIAVYAGIAGNSEHGAYSVVLSGVYEDDQDMGETFTYTGAGGRGPVTSFGGSGPQIEDQTFAHKDNSVLLKSKETQRSVRVVRGPNGNSRYAPLEGYRYDGLYKVEDAYLGKGKSGYLVCKYTLRRESGQDPLPKD